MGLPYLFSSVAILTKNGPKRYTLATARFRGFVGMVLRTSMVVAMAVAMVMVAVLMAVLMVMLFAMLVLMIMLVVVQALVRSRAARVFVEHQRFDGDRHRVGRHADAAEVDVVEIPQH